MGLLEFPFMTGVFGPLESDEFGLVLSSLLLSNDFLSTEIESNLLFKPTLPENNEARLIR